MHSAMTPSQSGISVTRGVEGDGKRRALILRHADKSAENALASGLVPAPPLLLGCLPCRVTGIASRLLFGLKQPFSSCLFGGVARCLLGRRALGVGCCLRCNLSSLREVALLALPRFFALHRAFGSRGGDGLALLSFLNGGRPFDERHFEFCQH